MPTTLNVRFCTSKDTTVSTQSPLEINLYANESVSELNANNENGNKNSLVDSNVIRELKTAITSLSSGIASGSDSIPNSILKCLPDNLLESHLVIYNNVFVSGQSPTEWSELDIVMIFKKGDREMAENYRGIALINLITKLFTSMICQRLTTWAQDGMKLPEARLGSVKAGDALTKSSH
ncbi:unnamed protein product [Allacma fusca]|uniref:Uncharacterized protein n=1 Tax=Allacma fusca TaxID=39272 RepID=A0A8J2NWF8_9HEXA|nr:unnamed protein product [Allacma fusca]